MFQHVVPVTISIVASVVVEMLSALDQGQSKSQKTLSHSCLSFILSVLLENNIIIFNKSIGNICELIQHIIRLSSCKINRITSARYPY